MEQNANKPEYFETGDFDRPKEPDLKSKFIKFLDSRYFVALCVVLVAVASFAIGRISKVGEQKEPVRVYDVSNNSPTIPVNTSPPAPLLQQERGVGQTASVQNAITPTNSEIVVASKNGTKYHYPWCAGAKQISPQNLITFVSPEAARSQGYTPAANCKGLK